MVIAVTKGTKEMTLVRSEQSRSKIAELFRGGPKGKKGLRSYFLKPYQLEIIDILSEETGKGKGEVVRDIFDEWVEVTLREGK